MCFHHCVALKYTLGWILDFPPASLVAQEALSFWRPGEHSCTRPAIRGMFGGTYYVPVAYVHWGVLGHDVNFPFLRDPCPCGGDGGTINKSRSVWSLCVWIHIYLLTHSCISSSWKSPERANAWAFTTLLRLKTWDSSLVLFSLKSTPRFIC